jgi:hypothetical protein
MIRERLEDKIFLRCVDRGQTLTYAAVELTRTGPTLNTIPEQGLEVILLRRV